MRILFTGGSSFTGLWLTGALKKSGHEIVAPLPRPKDAYTGLRKKRVALLQRDATVHFSVPFGSPPFLEIVESATDWDCFCHHAAAVEGYAGTQFNYMGAVEQNTHEAETVLNQLQKKGCSRLVLTGSLFEPNEGAGPGRKKAISKYGLSKGLTSMVYEYFADQFQFSLGKFVIPNPFGPYEEPRFTTYLVQQWTQNQTAEVQTPNYLRDNIHVSLLAAFYQKFISTLPHTPGFVRCTPSGYREKQGDFAKRFAREIGNRLHIDCPLRFARGHPCTQPSARVNPPMSCPTEWSEKEAWNTLADYYREHLCP